MCCIDCYSMLFLGGVEPASLCPVSEIVPADTLWKKVGRRGASKQKDKA